MGLSKIYKVINRIVILKIKMIFVKFKILFYVLFDYLTEIMRETRT